MPPRVKKDPAKPVTEEFDPFGEPDVNSSSDDSLGDEAQTELPPPWEVSDEADVNSTDTEKKAVITVGSMEDVITGTIKGGRDFDEPWLVVRAGSLEEYIKIVSDRELMGQAMDATQKASKAFRDFRPAEATPTATSAPQQASQPRSQGRPPAAGDGPLGKQYCNHGEKKFWSKFDDQKNEMVQIYFCPAPKGAADKCKNQYVN